MELMSSRTTIKTINGDSLTPILIFRRLQGSYKFLLESSSQHKESGRFSFIGANPRKTYAGSNNKILEYNYQNEQTYTHTGELFVLLKRLMPRISNTIEFPFSGGAVGYISCGASSKFTVKNEHLQLPDVHFHVYETIIVFDHLTDDVSIIHTNIDAEKQVPDLDALAHTLLFGETVDGATCDYGEVKDVAVHQFTRGVEEVRAAIEDDYRRVVLSKRFAATLASDPLAIYRTLRKKNPAPYMYYVTFEDHIVMGTSPESLIRVKGDCVIAMASKDPIKRGVTKSENLANEKGLRKDVEACIAHASVVAAVKDALQSVCCHDSVKVVDAMRIERSKQAYLMTSCVEGKLLPMLHALDALATSIPPFARTDTQNNQELSLLTEMRFGAGSFSGAVGFIGFNGQIDFALTGGVRNSCER